MPLMNFSRVTFASALSGMAVVVALGALGAFHSIEARTIDWRYANARSTAEPMSDEIALVSIDDKANDYMRWPWPRAEFAAACEEIVRLHPKVIACDVFQSNPELGTDGDSRWAEVIESARLQGVPIVLAAEVGGAADPFAQRWVDHPDWSLALLARVAAAPDEAPFHTGVDDAIERHADGSRNDEGLAMLEASRGSPESALRAAAWTTTPSVLGGGGAAWRTPAVVSATDFLTAIAPDRARPISDAFNDGRVDPAVRDALESAMAERSAWHMMVLRDTQSATERGSFTDRPPLLSFAQAGRACGSVTAGNTDAGDVKRRSQIRFDAEGGHLLSLGLTAAALMLDVPPGRVSTGRNELVVGDVQSPLEDGLLRLDWPTSTFQGATRLAGAQPADGAEQLSLAGFAAMARMRSERARIDDAIRALVPAHTALTSDDDFNALADRIDDEFLSADAPDDRVKRLAALLPERLEASQRLAALTADLAPRLKGKLVFVGWNATGTLADQVPTVYGGRTPGVFTHAVAADMVLRQHARVMWPAWTGPAIGVVFGVLTACAVAMFGTLGAAATVGLLIALWSWLAGVVAFDAWHAVVPLFVPINSSAGAWVCGTAVSAFISARDRARIQRQFGARVSPELVERLASDPKSLSMGGEEREIAVLFCDLAGFTTIAERLGGAGAVATLNTVMSALTDEIVATDGYVNKFLGDGIMAFWSAFEPQPDQASRAVRAAIRCQERMRELNARPGLEGLSLRIGLSMGKAIVGDCGAPPRLNDYTAIGDVVNLAARLESANKQFGTDILIEGSLATAATSGGATLVGLRSMGRVVVVGQSQPAEVWTVVPDRGAQERALWERAVAQCAASQHDAALEAWSEYQRTYGPSKTAQTFLDALAAGTPADGVLHLRAK